VIVAEEASGNGANRERRTRDRCQGLLLISEHYKGADFGIVLELEAGMG